MTADCLPVLVCDDQVAGSGSPRRLARAGSGILGATCAAYPGTGDSLLPIAMTR